MMAVWRCPHELTDRQVCAAFGADLREPGKILREAAPTLDFGQPVAIMLLGVLPHIGDYGEARSVVRCLVNGVASGSYLVISHAADIDPAFNQAQRRYNETGAVPYQMRSREQIAGFFDGLELVEPGVVPVPRWRPDPSPSGAPPGLPSIGGVGRKR